MDLNTSKFKKYFSLAQQILCCAIFIGYFFFELFIHFLELLGIGLIEESQYTFATKIFANSFILSFLFLIARNIILAILLIVSFFFKFSKHLHTIIKWAFVVVFIFTSFIFIVEIPFLIREIFTSENQWNMFFFFLFYSILLFLQPCYYRYFIFYRTSIVKTPKLLWLNIVPIGILYMLTFLVIFILKNPR